MGSFIDVMTVSDIRIPYFTIFHAHVTIIPIGNVGVKYPLGYRDFPHFENTCITVLRYHATCKPDCVC